jgi:hypothetical protein
MPTTERLNTRDFLRLLRGVQADFFAGNAGTQPRTPPYIVAIDDVTEGTASGQEGGTSCYFVFWKVERFVGGDATTSVHEHGPLRATPAILVFQEGKHIALLFQKFFAADVIDTVTVNAMTNLKTGVQVAWNVVFTNCQVTNIVSNGSLVAVEFYYDQIDISHNSFDRDGTAKGSTAGGGDFRTWQGT